MRVVDQHPEVRFVVRGYEESAHELAADSPTLLPESFRFLLLATVAHGWPLHCVDVRKAYYQVQELDRPVYTPSPLREWGMMSYGACTSPFQGFGMQAECGTWPSANGPAASQD
jgi:hypothetical protein